MKIGLTQRVEVVPGYKERRDCLDQRWHLILSELGFLSIPIPNILPGLTEKLEKFSIEGFILTGGNDISCLPKVQNPAHERDNTENTILQYAQLKGLPVLGICRGLQVINIFFGGSLVPIEEHVAKRHPVYSYANPGLFTEYSEVNSFHTWGLWQEHLGCGLNTKIVAADNSIEAFDHRSLPWFGIMWHPERENPFNQTDLKLIASIFGR